MKIRRMVLALTAMGALLGTGCNNVMEEQTRQSSRVEENDVKLRYDVALAPENIKDVAYWVNIEKYKTADVKRYEVQTTYQYVVPYNGWREIYLEIPAGFCLIPAGLCCHILSLLSLGVVPFSWGTAINQKALEGLNPFMNWEDRDRMVEQIIGTEEKLLSHKIENTNVPLAETGITVRSGANQREFQTDAFGRFQLSFLSLTPEETFVPMGRNVSFSLTADDTELRSLTLTRRYLSNLRLAQNHISDYQNAPSGKILLATVLKLEEIGFEQLAFALEEQELKTHQEDNTFIDDFAFESQK